MEQLFGGCGRAVDGSFWCFGPPVTEETDLHGALDVSSPSAGFTLGSPPGGFQCAVLPDHTVACDGSDVNGQLGFDPSSTSSCTYDCSGIGSWQRTTCPYPCQNTLRRVAGVSDAVGISANAGPGPCAVRMDGSVICWGGLDPSTDKVRAPAPIALPDKATKIAGGQGSCAVLASGQLACWTLSAYGPIDESACPMTGCALPAVVPDLDEVVDVSITGGHGCGVRADGSAFCWGESLAGELGDGMFANHATPVRVASTLRFAHVSTDLALTCATTQDGQVACWGYGETQVGRDGTTSCAKLSQFACRPTPTLVAGITNAKQVSAATSAGNGSVLAYVLRKDGTVIGVGEDAHGWVLQQVAP